MKIFYTILILIPIIWLLAFQQPNLKQIEKGRKLAKSCINCHGTIKGDMAWPLQRIRDYRTQEWLAKMVYNPAGFMYQNEEAAALFKGKSIMQAFPQYSKNDINAILDYFDSLPYNPENYKHRKNWKKISGK